MKKRTSIDDLLKVLAPKDYELATIYYTKGDYSSVKDLVDSTIITSTKDRLKGKDTIYAGLDLDKLNLLKVYIDEFLDSIEQLDNASDFGAQYEDLENEYYGF